VREEVDPRQPVENKDTVREREGGREGNLESNAMPPIHLQTHEDEMNCKGDLQGERGGR